MTINGTTPNGKDRSNLIPFSSRLREGRALAQDVWSIFKCVRGTGISAQHTLTHLHKVLLTSPRIALTSDRVT